MKKLFFVILLLVVFVQQNIFAQSTKNISVKTITGFELDDNSDLYNNKTIRLHAYYEADRFFNKNLRYADNESEGAFSPSKLKQLEEYIGSNENYYSRKVSIYGTGTKIVIRIPFTILKQVPNIGYIGYIYITGKWLSEYNVLMVNSISRVN